MAVLKASLSLCSIYSSSSSSSCSSSSSSKLLSFPKTLICPSKLNSPKSPIVLPNKSRKLLFQLCSAVQEISVEEEENASEETHVENQKRKLYVVNLPWSLSVVDIKELFGQCGTVSDVEVLVFLSFSLLSHFFRHCLVFIFLNCLDYKAKRWKEPRLCLCYNVFWGRSSGCH